jgi:hypothetical protein
VNRRKPLKPAARFTLRWLSSKGLEISPEMFRRIEGKFDRSDLPRDEQEAVDSIVRVSVEHYEEWKKVARAAKRIERQQG